MSPTAGPFVPPDPARAVDRIALRVGATSMAHVDATTLLSGVCAALPGTVGATAAALVLTEPADPLDPAERHVFASDDAAARLGLIQHRTGRGPVSAAQRADRVLVVPDLTVSGPPELAAAAADCGLTRSLVVPVPVAGQPAGGLQLLTGPDAPLDESVAAVLGPLVAAVAARLVDAREIARLRLDAERARPQAASVDDTTVRLTTAPPEPGGPAVPGLFTTDEPGADTPPVGQADLGREGAGAGRLGAAAVPAQRSRGEGDDLAVVEDLDEPTRRVPRHRLRDDG